MIFYHYAKEGKMKHNKSVIITGSTSGIGLAIAHSFAQQKYNVMLNGIADEATVKAIKDELSSQYHVLVEYSPADMSKADQVAEMVKYTEQKLGTVDVLINNAGIQHIAAIEDFPDEKWNLIMEINLNSCFHAIKHALPLMKKNNFGRIINIASVHGLIASINKSAYVSAKHGLVGMTRAVAIENARLNITCNAICPGWVKTPLVEMQIEKLAKEKNMSMSEAEAFLLAEGQPSLKFVDPKDIGALAVFLASDAAKSITGAAIPIDGAWTAH